MEFVVAEDVERDSERVVGFAAHLAEVESGYSDGVVDNNLITVPARVTAQSAVKSLKVTPVFNRAPCFWLGDQTACPLRGRPQEAISACVTVEDMITFSLGNAEPPPSGMGSNHSPDLPLGRNTDSGYDIKQILHISTAKGNEHYTKRARKTPDSAGV